MPVGDPTFTTGAAGNVTIHTPPPPIVLPRFGDWPRFHAPSWLRNGREAGAWLGGVISVIPQKCAHVTIDDDQVAGAIHAMVEGGLQVKAYSSGDDGGQTFEVRSIHHEFVDPE